MINAKIAATPKEVRKFGLLFAAICLGIVAYVLYRGHETWPWYAGGAAFFLTTGLFAIPVLRPIYIVWMKFAHILGWINTRLLLGIFYFLILTPIGLVMRLFGKDLLDEKLEPNALSYWKVRTPAPYDRERTARLF